jgi:hypothetical protein
VLTAASSAHLLRFVVDGAKTAEMGLPFRMPWRLSPGPHRVAVEVAGVTSEVVRFEVVAP